MTLWEFLLMAGILIGVFVAGIICTILFYFFFDKLKMWRLKKTIPRTPEGKLDYEKMKVTPKPEIDERGQKEDERKKFEKFREFEKLRSSAARGSDAAATDRSPASDNVFAGVGEDERREPIQDANADGDSGDKRNSKKRVKIRL